MFSSLIIASLFAVVALVSANPCPDDTWRYSPHDHKCYKLYNEKTGWVLGEFKCAFQGSHHVSVHDTVQNKFITELARQADIIWLGIAQFGTSQDYVWSDRTGFDFEQWHEKHSFRRPTYNKGRKCAKLDSATGTWMQSCCKVPAAFICQKPAGGPRPSIQMDKSMETGANDLRKFRFRRL